MDKIEKQAKWSGTIDRDLLWYNVQRSAHTFDQVDVLHREVGRRLLEHLDFMPHAPERILDLGAGSGRAVPGLRQKYPHTEILLLDGSPARIHRAIKQNTSRSHFLPNWFTFRQKAKLHGIVGDIGDLPFDKASLDWVWSNLVLHWHSAPMQVLSEIARVLRPQRGIGTKKQSTPGLFVFSTLGPDSLCELREACAIADATILGQSEARDDSDHIQQNKHILPFIDMHDWGDFLVRAGFVDPVIEMEKINLVYPNMKALLGDLRLSGSGNVLSNRRRGLYPSAWMKAVYQAYEKYRHNEQLPVTIEVIYGHAWRGIPRVPKIATEQPIYFKSSNTQYPMRRAES